MNSTFSCIKKLSQFLELSEENRALVEKAHPFRLNVPFRLAEKMRKNCLEDPLFLQFVPLQKRPSLPVSFSKEPLQEALCSPKKKLLHKYFGRALLLVSANCAMHCRYCFRQNFPYEKEVEDFSEEFAYIAANPSIQEVILSGGDPLSASDSRLDQIFSHLHKISHVKKIRIHTRFPIGFPSRISRKLCSIFARSIKQVVFVLHINHPLEWGEDLREKLLLIQRLGIPVFTQSVLLKGVNDAFSTLFSLYTQLSDAGIVPYYLHHLDPVEGSERFFVTENVGTHLIEKLREHLPGYAVPTYVKEIPGSASKVPIFPCAG